MKTEQQKTAVSPAPRIQQNRLDRVARFRASLPLAYSETEVERLPLKESSEKLLDWKPKAPKDGLYLFGNSGTGKTRTALMRAQRMIEDGTVSSALYVTIFDYRNGIEPFALFYAVENQDFKLPFPNLELQNWKTSLYATGLLIIDMVDFISLSPLVFFEFADLLQTRTENCMPTVLIGTGSLDEWLKSLSHHKWFRNLEWRVRDYYRAIEFKS